MAFRGCAGVSADQTAAIFAQLGGYGNADTQQNITQYFTTVPAADLDVALRLDAACMQDVDDSQAEWAQEKGAIEQEVARDLSEPTYKFLTRLNEDMFSGTPYAHDALGTRESFEATTGAMLKAFYKDWYAPNNAILVVAGDVDPAATLARIKELYGPIPRRPMPRAPDGVARAGEARELHARQQPAVHARVHLVSPARHRQPGLRRRARCWPTCWRASAANIYALVPAGKALEARVRARRRPIRRRASASRLPRCRPAPTRRRSSPSMTEIVADYAQNGRAGRTGGRREAQSEIAARRVPDATRSRIWRPPGRRRWPPKGATRPTRTSMRSGA